jgi:amidase
MNDLWSKSATELANLIRARNVTALEVTNSALARLSQVNPAINAVVDEMPEQAIAAAKAVDQMIANGKEPGLLCGVPVTVKANVDQTNCRTTNGLQLQAQLVAQKDSPVVSNLRKAGAIIIGRTNTPAFSLRWFTRNSLHGHTLNPHNPDITPGGSSGGSAAAVSSGIGAIAHGTDIGGSIRYPAYACGIHGLRPTLGRVPALNDSGAERYIGGQLMAVSGPLARTMADIRLGFEAMAAEDLRDPWWTPVPLNLPLKQKRAALCINPDGLEVAPEVEKALRESAKILLADGWQVDEVDCPSFRQPAELQAVLWLAEMRKAESVIEQENDPDALFVYEQMKKLSPPTDLDGFMTVLQGRATWTRIWQLFLDEYPIVICPVSSELPFPDLLDIQSAEGFKRVLDAQLTQVGLPLMGLPGLVVSTDMIGNIPVGVQLIAGRYQENALLLAGEVIERGSNNPGIANPV